MKEEDSHMTDLQGVPKFTISKTPGLQAAMFEATKKAIGIHMGRKYGYNMKNLVIYDKENEFQAPKLKDKALDKETMEWKASLNLCLKKKDEYMMEKSQVVSIIYGHCEDSVQQRLDCDEVYKKADQENDVIKVLELIKTMTYGSNNKKYIQYCRQF